MQSFIDQSSIDRLDSALDDVQTFGRPVPYVERFAALEDVSNQDIQSIAEFILSGNVALYGRGYADQAITLEHIQHLFVPAAVRCQPNRSAIPTADCG
jgi:hypothetical protein